MGAGVGRGIRIHMLIDDLPQFVFFIVRQVFETFECHINRNRNATCSRCNGQYACSFVGKARDPGVGFIECDMHFARIAIGAGGYFHGVGIGHFHFCFYQSPRLRVAAVDGAVFFVLFAEAERHDITG